MILVRCRRDLWALAASILVTSPKTSPYNNFSGFRKSRTHRFRVTSYIIWCTLLVFRCNLVSTGTATHLCADGNRRALQPVFPSGAV